MRCTLYITMYGFPDYEGMKDTGTPLFGLVTYPTYQETLRICCQLLLTEVIAEIKLLYNPLNFGVFPCWTLSYTKLKKIAWNFKYSRPVIFTTSPRSQKCVLRCIKPVLSQGSNPDPARGTYPLVWWRGTPVLLLLNYVPHFEIKVTPLTRTPEPCYTQSRVSRV